uniref:Uncharacterized protein n=1 Tax=Oncorhynchus kisutch TaxID=8019 RepID=A0A8C7HPT6_ONCKI
MGDARKLQKKLRWIEHLEIDISQSLTPEERIKVFRKAELRTRLAELLLQLSGPQQTPGIVAEGKHEEMKNQKEMVTRGETGRREETGGRRETGAGGEQSEPCLAVTDTSPKENQEDAVFPSLKASWEKAMFRLRTMEGHSDIITCVVAVDNLVRESFSDLITDLITVNNSMNHFLSPSSSLCNSDMLTFSSTTESHSRINRVLLSYLNLVCFHSHGLSLSLSLSLSHSFHLQTWSWQTMDNCQSIKPNEEAVTSLQSQGPLMFSSSAEGGVSVWEGLCTNHDPLQLLHPWDAMVTGCGSQGVRLTLSPRGDRLSVAYGTVSRLTNHSSFAGERDCVHQTADGERTLNLFSLPQCRYLASLTCADAPGIVCFAAWLTGSEGHRWVTGGCALAVWEQLPSSGKGDVTTKRDNPLDASMTESEGDSEEDSDGEEWVEVGSLHTLRLESLKLVFQQLHKNLVNKL